jgi:hypothetical protein
MGCGTTRRIEAELEASTIRWGRLACREITFVADDTDSLDDEFILLEAYTPEGTKVVYEVGKGVDPETPGTTFVSVSFTTDSTAAQVASAFNTALDGISGAPFALTLDGAKLTVKNRFIGKTEDDMQTSGFTLDTYEDGLDVALGATSDSIDISLEVSVLDITSNQTGGIVADQIFQGLSAELTGAFIEITKDRFDLLVGSVTGDSVTPAAGTTVTGFGESRLFQSLAALGGVMILHPIRLPNTDRSNDWVFWRSAPKLNGLNFDGTAPQAMDITFEAYLDQSVNKKINLAAKGDWAQEGLDA